MRRDLRIAVVAGGALAALALLAIPGGGSAQRVIPQIGVYVPVSDLGQIDGFDGAVDLGKKESSRAYGLGIEWGGGGSIGLRGNIAYATPSEVPLAGMGCASCSSRSSMFALTGGVVLRPFRLFFIEPYFVAGTGVKRYDFSSTDFEAGFDFVVDDRTERTYQFAVGGELGLGFLSGQVEISDYVSRYRPVGFEEQRRHDFIVSIGLGFGS